MPQSLATVYLHLVFSTKNRDALIDADVEPKLYAYLGGIARDCQSPLLAIGGMPDHVHLICSLSRTISIADFTEELKRGSSKWMKSQGARYHTFQWQAGYVVFSIGQSNMAALVQYIAQQKRHHKKTTFKDELRTLFKKYLVKYDERYVWD